MWKLVFNKSKCHIPMWEMQTKIDNYQIRIWSARLLKLERSSRSSYVCARIGQSPTSTDRRINIPRYCNCSETANAPPVETTKSAPESTTGLRFHTSSEHSASGDCNSDTRRHHGTAAAHRKLTLNQWRLQKLHKKVSPPVRRYGLFHICLWMRGTTTFWRKLCIYRNPWSLPESYIFRHKTNHDFVLFLNK